MPDHPSSAASRRKLIGAGALCCAYLVLSMRGVFAQGGLAGKQLVGATAVSKDRELVGAVDDIIYASDGTPQTLIIGLGGFLGLGEKDVSVPANGVQILPDERRPATSWDGKYAGTNPAQIVVPMTMQELAAAPAYQAGQTGAPAANSGSPSQIPDKQPPSSTESGGPG